MVEVEEKWPFVLDYLALTKGKSEKDLLCFFGDSIVVIEDARNRDFKLRAIVNAEGTLFFHLQTKIRKLGLLPQRHPDLYAGRFVRCMTNFYFPAQGTKIRAVQETWYQGSDNWRDYHWVLDTLGDEVLAAKSTISGRILASCGFTKVPPESVRELDTYRKGRKVEALFLPDRKN